MNIQIVTKDFSNINCEFVERKGIGHPDTLADALAEHLSVEYSKYTLQDFGAILHHNFDKVGLLGGASHVKFGEGRLTSPIRVLLNGRASTKFADTAIHVKELLIKWTKEFFRSALPMIDSDIDLVFHYNLSNQSSPGKTEEKNSDEGTRKYWFEPRGLHDLQERKRLFSNDTSMGVGYAPYSRLESIILEIEKALSAIEFKKQNPWIGSDIKIMGFRQDDKFDITLCIPQISKYVKNVDEYKFNLEFSRKYISNLIENNQISDFNIYINTRDNYEKSELYLTAIGTSIESGDEGLVGRGNRINGVISPMRLMSMEGACGKNPVYHIGKLYYVAADQLSQKLYSKFNIENEVVLVSQSGRDLIDPWVTYISIPKETKNIDEIKVFVEEELQKIPELTMQLLDRQVRMY